MTLGQNRHFTDASPWYELFKRFKDSPVGTREFWAHNITASDDRRMRKDADVMGIRISINHDERYPVGAWVTRRA